MNKNTTSNKEKRLILYTDGGCRGQPGGVAAYGYHIRQNNNTFREDYGILKEGEGATNNYAEYMAPIKALAWLKKSDNLPTNIEEIIVKSDSQLLVKQIKGEWSVKSDNLIDLYSQLKKLIKYFKDKSISVNFFHVGRDENERADELTNIALDDYELLQKIQKKEGEETKKCPECGEEMVVREGKYGKFYGCTGYPECKHTENYEK